MILKYTILALYFGILFVIGIVASRRVKGAKDFFVGGKKLGFWVVAFSARATGESAWLLLGLTGMGAAIGMKAFWVVGGEMLGVVVAWFIMAKPFKRITDDYDSMTIPDYLVSHFKSTTHLLRIVAATALSVFVVIYVSAQIDATGQAFEFFFDWNYYVGAIVGFLIVLAYIFTGGFVAVAWSDLFQGLIMFVGLVVLPIVAFYHIGDFGKLTSGLEAIDPNLLSWTNGEGVTLLSICSIAGLALIGLGFMGSPQIFVRFMSIKDESEINKGRWVAIVYTLLSDIAAVCIGILARYLFTGTPEGDAIMADNDTTLPLLVEHLMPAVLVGIYVAAVLSAVMSTIDSLLVVASSAITRDFYQQIFKPDLKEAAMGKLSRIVTLIIALAALGVAMGVALSTEDRSIFWFVIFGWSGIAATFCPVMILSLFWKGYTETGAIVSMITGFLSVPIFKFLVPKLSVIGPYFEELEALPPAFFFAALAGIVASLATRASHPKKDVSAP